MRRFEGKVVLVTGAASGIGRASALRLGREGARVACVDIRIEGAVETAKLVKALGTEASALECDVSDRASVSATVAKVAELFGRIDVLCNIAGILRSEHTLDLKLEDWNRIINVNLTGTFLMCQAALPHLLKVRGNIVNMSSTAALGSHPWMAAYAASKGGILSLSRALAIEYVKQGLRVNAVCPGGIKTSLHEQFTMPKDADMELLRGAMPLVEQVGPEHAASVVAFLASDDAYYVTGTELRVDGGALS